MKSIIPKLESLNAILDSISSLSELESEELQYLDLLISELKAHQSRLGISDNSCSQKDAKTVQASTRHVDEREAILQRVLETLACSQFEEANEILKDIINDFPEDVEFIIYLACTSWELGEMKQSADLYKKAMDLSCPTHHPPTDWLNQPEHTFLRAMEGRALALYQLSQWDEAIKLFETIYTLNPFRFRGCIYLAGEAYHLKGEPDKALEKYALSPNEPCVFYNKALALLQLEQPIQAAENLVKAFNHNPHIAAKILNKKTSLKSQALGFLATEAYAEDFLDACGDLWRSKQSIAFLGHIFNHPIVQGYLGAFDENGNFSSPEGFFPNLGKNTSSELYEKNLQQIIAQLFSIRS